jgi:hypothetical protein
LHRVLALEKKLDVVPEDKHRLTHCEQVETVSCSDSNTKESL